ncbi:glycosyltransferase family 4 protein [Litchfieldia salsa]|uniref:Glycosyltransferase EpsD n=1 Tax=Litchfieldia salsa TaxID=930152 RepID=A0A1H0VE70_9BACI|nr:glycosyltransferase family 4 protein [Litchfieldia salsa]SDP76674.1 glycosyltransferase EpsD [Litchfieldia salsa]
MKKILFCATVDYHFKAFHLPYLKWFKEQGWEVHVAAAGEIELPYVDQKFNISIQRSPHNRKNVGAYKELKQIIENNQYQLIHCHTPMGGVLARLAARTARKKGTKVIYTAHGFHFCKGAPLLNWLIYYPIEKMLAKNTDCLITINQEDYELANKRLKADRIEHVHGVGVDIERFKPISIIQKNNLRISYGFKLGDFLLFYAAEFNKNKNQQLLIKALAQIKDEVPNAKLLLCGEGDLLEQCRELAGTLELKDRVHFLGFRTDLDQLIPMCDVAVASSLREGLPVNIMESMACGLPVVAVGNRGHSELINHRETGYLVLPEQVEKFGEYILDIYMKKDLRKKMSLNSIDRMKLFTVYRVSLELTSIYESYMVEDMDEAQNKHNRAYI